MKYNTEAIIISVTDFEYRYTLQMFLHILEKSACFDSCVRLADWPVYRAGSRSAGRSQHGAGVLLRLSCSVTHFKTLDMFTWDFVLLPVVVSTYNNIAFVCRR